jgi:GNAT superfamily N-acetyltransferase
MITHTTQLSRQQLEALDALSASCKHVDGNEVMLYRHLLSEDRGRPANIFYHASHQLLGFLAAFFFQEKTCEIALMVHPAHRRKGIATQLIKSLVPLLVIEDIQTLVFSTPPEINNPWLPSWGLNYEHSEYQMQRRSLKSIPLTKKTYSNLSSPRRRGSIHEDDPNSIFTMDPRLRGEDKKVLQLQNKTLRLATTADLPSLCALDEACFANPTADASARFHALLNDPNYRIFVILKDEVIIGKAHLRWQLTDARLTDLGIIPTEQGHGYGSLLLAHCVNETLAANRSILRLDVESMNQRALNLYLRLDFNLHNATDYWKTSEFGLTDFLRHL